MSTVLSGPYSCLTSWPTFYMPRLPMVVCRASPMWVLWAQMMPLDWGPWSSTRSLKVSIMCCGKPQAHSSSSTDMQTLDLTGMRGAYLLAFYSPMPYAQGMRLSLVLSVSCYHPQGSFCFAPLRAPSLTLSLTFQLSPSPSIMMV